MSAAGPNSKPLKSAFANKRKQGSSGDNGGNNGAGGGGGGGGGGGWAQKRVKIRNDREIAAQSSDAALRDGELDLQSFLNAREFEIRALEESMRHTKAEATSRAFQQVPRGLRRRTASHNAKRVPKRLRRRALKEMAEDNTPVVLSKRRKPKTTRARIRAETAKRLGMLAEKKRRRAMKAAKAKEKDGEEETTTTTGEAGDGPSKGAVTVTTRPPRPKIRRNQLNDPPQRKSKFRKRQINKTWLPTHLWHAKRARMTEPANPLWRFAVPLTPNEKTYRATHRSHGDRGAVVWDTSYVSTIGLYGSAKGVEQVLRRLGVVQEGCWNERGRTWREGTRHWSGFLSREVRGGGGGERREVCPAMILWNPEPVTEDGDGAQTVKVQRQVFVRVHPSAFLEVFNELLRLVKMQNPRMYIEDLRFEIGGIELTGPASTEALLGFLHSYHTAEGSREQHADIFNGLTSLMSPASLPLNATLGFSIMDPRLRYPPRKVAQLDPDDEEEQNRSLDLLANWPAETNLKPHALFHRDARASATRLPSQKSIDRRKGARRPGTDLSVSDADPPIPVILVASRALAAANNNNKNNAQGNWTLLAPWRCIQPLWHSLVHFPLSSGGNPRFSGLDQIRQVAFERGAPCFPFDFLGTDAGAAWEVEQRRLRKASWERRPKSKRVAWASLDLGAGRKGEVGCGWACDVEFLFREETTTTKGREEEEERSAAAATDADEMDVDKPSPAKETEAAAGDDASEAEFLKTLQHIRKDAFKAHTSSPSLATTSPLPPRSVINVKLSILNRGVVTACARIYRLPSRPAPTDPTSSAEVPATVPPPPSPPTTSVQGGSSSLPPNLRAQWLATIPIFPGTTKKNGKAKHHQQQANLPLATQKQILAQKLLASPVGSIGDAASSSSLLLPAKPNQTDMNGHHPLVPDEKDLLGFVTTGSYCLAEGRGTAIGCLSAEKAAEAMRDGGAGGREGTLCIMRNAGESVGWIARWEVA